MKFMQINYRLNKIIDLLPSDIFKEWAPHLELVDLKLGQVLHEPGRIVSHLHFPLTAIVSWIRLLENGDTTQVAMTGKEGVVGIYLLMGAAHTHNQAVVQKAGTALRLRLSVVLGSFNQGNPVQQLLLRYTQTLITQMAQGAVCHRHHAIEQQLCSMLLLTLDRQDGDSIAWTHETMANLLGVRREGVTQAAKRLMNDDVLSYSRGRITVLNRAALAERACECHGVIRDEERRLLTP